MNNLISDKWLLIMMCLFATTSFVSVVGANIFLGTSTLLFLLICYKNKSLVIFQDIFSYIKAIGVFALVLLVSALLSGDIGNGLKIWADYFLWRFVPFVLVIGLLENRKIEKILYAILGGFLIDCLFAIYQYVFTGLSIDNGRPSGLVGSPMTLAGFFCIILPILFTAIFYKDISKKLRIVFAFIFFVACIASFFNATRGAWLALGIVIIVECIVFTFDNKKYILTFGCIVLSVGVLLAQSQFFMKRVASICDMNDISNVSRFVMWDIAFDMFENKPVFGVGLGQYKVVYQDKYIRPKLESKKEEFSRLPGFNKLKSFEKELILNLKANIWKIEGLRNLEKVDRRRIRSEYFKQLERKNFNNIKWYMGLSKFNHAHSNIFQILAENGLVGLFGYILAFGFILWRNIKNYLLNKNPYALMITASTAALVLQGLTEYNFGNGAVMKIYWLILACLIVLVKAYNEEKLRE